MDILIKKLTGVDIMNSIAKQGVSKELAKAFAELKNQKSGLKIVSKKINKDSN